MNKLKIIFSFLILFSVINCGKLFEKVEEKVNRKIDEKVDEQLNKMDSNFKKINIDSLKRLADSLSNDPGKKRSKRR